MKFVFNMGIWDILGLGIIAIFLLLIIIAYVGTFVIDIVNKIKNKKESSDEKEVK